MQFEPAGSGHSAAPAYPRRRVLRLVLRSLAGLAFTILGRVRIEGRENLPQGGPYIMVANHFHFSDPVALLWVCRRQVEFIGGFRFIMVPRIVHSRPTPRLPERVAPAARRSRRVDCRGEEGLALRRRDLPGL